MRVLTSNTITEMDSKILALYVACKGYFPNSIILKDSAKAIHESGRTKENSYQVINRDLKKLKQHGLVVKHGKGLRLISKMEISNKYNKSIHRRFVKIEGENKKDTLLSIIKEKLRSRLAQVEFRKLTKSERPNKNLKKAIMKVIADNQGAFTQISYAALSKYFNINKHTLRRLIIKLYIRGEISIIGATRKKVRRLAKLEEPSLGKGDFFYKGWVYHVESPYFRVNSIDLASLLTNGMVHY